MITSKDLRIENIVLAAIGGKLEDLREVIVYGINESGAIYCQQMEKPLKGIDEHYDKHLYGVPLTSEWLERMGFEVCKDEAESPVLIYYVKEFRYIGDLVSEIGEDGILYVHDCQDEKTRIYFVHEIQNIHYALYREELIIKPK